MNRCGILCAGGDFWGGVSQARAADRLVFAETGIEQGLEQSRRAHAAPWHDCVKGRGDA